MPNVFRPQYRELSEEEKARLDTLKTAAEVLHEMMFIDGTDKGQREMALARTNLEQAVMWAVKGITS